MKNIEKQEKILIFYTKIVKPMDLNEKKAYVERAFRQLQADGKVKTQGEFARLLGVSQNTISAAKNGDERYLTPSLIAKIDYLLDHSENDQPSAKMIPVFPVEAMAGTMTEFFASVKEYDCERMVSPIKGADYAIKIYGDSMSPEFPSGSLCLIKKVDEKQFIAWNEVYVLDTDNGAVIKKIRRTDKEDVVECVSINPAYQPFTIDISYIHGWYRVLMVMSVK